MRVIGGIEFLEAALRRSDVLSGGFTGTRRKDKLQPDIQVKELKKDEAIELMTPGKSFPLRESSSGRKTGSEWRRRRVSDVETQLGAKPDMEVTGLGQWEACRSLPGLEGQRKCRWTRGLEQLESLIIRTTS